MRTFAQKPMTNQQDISSTPMTPGRTHFEQSHNVPSILHLHRTIGNQAVQRLLQPNTDELQSGPATTASKRFGHDFSRMPVFAQPDSEIQPKLTVSTPKDRYEQEADRVADQVMRMPEPELERNYAYGGGRPECINEQAGRELAQPKPILANYDAKPAETLIAQNGTPSNGRPLDSNTRKFMESRLGQDFTRVRVHTDPVAAQAAFAFQARAFTLGHDIAFGEGQYAPNTLNGRRLLAHELTHVVQQRAAGAPAVIQRQQEDEQQQPDGGTPEAQPLPQQSGQGLAQVVQQQQQQQRPWTPRIPYIWFDLHDSFRALAEPQGPYLYSSYAYVDRVVNPNFQNNLNPGPVRDLTTRLPSGWPAQRNDLQWFFSTKFFVDAGDAHLPPQYTRLETSADIRFAPTAGGAGFSYQFSDNNPSYLSPGTLSYPFTLNTIPFGFRAQDVIMEPGTLHWDARLLVAYADDRVPLGIDFLPPPGITNTNALVEEIANLGLRRRDPMPGEAARRYRVSYTPRANDRFDIHIDTTEEDGSALTRRTLPNIERGSLVLPPALVIVIGADFETFGRSSAGRRHVEIRASQRAPFERLAASTP